MRSRARTWSIAGGLVTTTVVLSAGCETIAGYDDAQPWPPDAAIAADGSDVSQPALDDASTDAAPADVGDPDTSSAPDAQDAAACPVKTGGAICSQLPRFTAAAQVVDGIGDEFCDVPATVFSVNDAKYKQSAPDAGGFPEVVTFRAAWSSDALHVHAHVTDPHVMVPTTGSLADGDALLVYVAGSGALTGAFNGTTDGGAVQILVSPASGASPARGYLYYFDPPGRTATLDPSLFASRLVPGGYEIEIRFPWPTQKDPNAVKQGGTIGIDPGLIVKDSAGTTTQDLETALGFRPLASGTTSSCASGTLAPWCDDRTWCLTTLQ